MPTKWRSLSWPQTLCDVISPCVLAEVSHDLPLIKRRHWLNWRLKLTELSATGAKDGKRTLTQASLSDHRRRKQAFWLLYPRNNNNNSVYTQNTNSTLQWQKNFLQFHIWITKTLTASALLVCSLDGENQLQSSPTVLLWNLVQPWVATETKIS